jgi:NADPH:quinone reductase-like Zn-dependent oxidoreductase
LPVANPTVHDGSWAELISVPEDTSVASKPATPDMAESGVAPLTGITALAALDALVPSAGERVLVIGAPGGVGSFFVQLAAQADAHVIAPALADDVGYLRELGASEILDRTADLQAAIRERLPTASTRSSISSPTRRRTRCSEKPAGSPRPSAPRARDRAGST